MRINSSSMTVADIRDMMAREDLVVNKSYQRSSGIWPVTAQSYFIDTLLEGYPFPKVYFYETFDRKSRRSKKEIIDGQQRITTIMSYIENQFKLGNSSKNYKGMNFESLDEADQETILMATVQVDTILQAERSELLEMFRRMNAYTAPLNAPEKRNAKFQGEFKWFILELSDKYAPLLEEYGIFTSKQLIRMADADFIAELALVLDQGIINRAETATDKIYKKYEEGFEESDRYFEIICSFFDELKTSLSPLRETFMMKPYALHSLFCGMVHKRYGIPNGEVQFNAGTDGYFYRDLDATLSSLIELATDHELQNLDGKHKAYVEACLSTTHRIAQRTARSKAILEALQ